jgi:hypothetical protein
MPKSRGRRTSSSGKSQCAVRQTPLGCRTLCCARERIGARDRKRAAHVMRGEQASSRCWRGRRQPPAPAWKSARSLPTAARAGSHEHGVLAEPLARPERTLRTR